MKILEIVGTNAPKSYNRLLLAYMQKRYGSANKEISLLEIKDIPLFNEAYFSEDRPASVQNLYDQVNAADGVIISTPEYDHAITAALKSVMEWLSCEKDLMYQKPVMLVGTSLGVQGTSRAQDNLRQILNSPGLAAKVMAGNEFLLGLGKQKFDEQGQLTDQNTIDFLDECFNQFLELAQAN
ncbi:NADPH-dependent FMN reductase [Loigolactobacillus bifermentans]|uniref:Flavin reductase n=1 Tax=Loigolactobacillus bifermentans DSM 20003 TaxID=1423726 RepID=A0A0R1GL16_9LACO|nr:NADPH-dependent FMN reductase [Loigolactobacillus bifermentans]KRK32561.1 flavin reductase [Loigolactobacillus bifermentans DSM 20003]QGG60232.1 NAD(P)H-dependent oxidoreductase [Loigolactobacillus bifermentans]